MTERQVGRTRLIRANTDSPLTVPLREILLMTVLHVDQDFELIADLTGQAMERLNT